MDTNLTSSLLIINFVDLFKYLNETMYEVIDRRVPMDNIYIIT